MSLNGLARIYSLLGGDQGIYQTVSAVQNVIYYALRDPKQYARSRAQTILYGIPEQDELAEITALFNFTRDHLHYLNDPEDLEYVKSFEVLDQELSSGGSFFGDCDDACVYLGSLLKSVGFSVSLIIVSPQNSPDDAFRHIYLKALLRRKNQWVSLDATAKGKPMGWEVPYKRIKEYAI